MQQLQSQKDYQGAIILLNEAISMYPKVALFYTARGASNFNTRHFRAAVADATEAIRLDPNDKQNYYIRGNALVGMGQTARGQQDLQKAR